MVMFEAKAPNTGGDRRKLRRYAMLRAVLMRAVLMRAVLMRAVLMRAVLMRAVLKRFATAQEGTLTMLALCLFILMVMMGGLAVDLMRFEQTRTTLQNTLDRATLASASLTQKLTPVTVVTDYFAKAGMQDYLRGVTVTEGMNFRNVVADAAAATDPIFMHMMGIDQLDAKGHSMAEQRINNVEIMLVLDVSGSMLTNSRLVNLKSAATEFVDTVLTPDTDHKISIGIVPFNGQVNIGPDLRAKYTALTDDPGVTDVQCVELPSTVYASTSLPTSTVMSMAAHADTYSTTNQNGWLASTSTSWAVGYDATYNALNVWCPPKSGNIVRLPQQNVATLQGYINGLSAIGATSINAGMKWGVALIDPSARSMYTQFISASKMPATEAGRPFNFTDDNTMKIVVLMTDGEHFAEERVKPAFKSGLSNIYKSNNDSNYSVYHATVSGTSKYWVPHLGTWQNVPWTNSTKSGTFVQQTWPQVWAKMRLSYVAYQYYARAGVATYTAQMDAFRSQTPTTTMDSQLQQICGLAKGQGVIVYGIAFEASAMGQTQIANCSTSSAHYFNAAGLQIKTAFRAIASNISQLRLTQ
jgi:Flp pilus assembly protein TadG